MVITVIVDQRVISVIYSNSLAKALNSCCTSLTALGSWFSRTDDSPSNVLGIICPTSFDIAQDDSRPDLRL